MRTFAPFETLWADVRYATRSLLNNPGFLVVVVLSLALGIAANSTIFSVLNALLYRPLPAPAPENRPQARYSEVSANVFETLKIPLLKGRYLDEHDTESGPWVISTHFFRLTLSLLPFDCVPVGASHFEEDHYANSRSTSTSS
jgi:hypothetical protein